DVYKRQEQRAYSVSVLAKIIHDTIVAEETEEAVYNFENKVETEWDKAHLREAKKQIEKQKKIPSALVAEKSKRTIIAQSVWEKTKPLSDFQAFLPYLEGVVEITKEIAKCGDSANPYNFLLDDYEPYITTEELDPLFENLKNGLKELVRKYSVKDVENRKKAVSKYVSIANQEKIGRFFLDEIGFDFERGRMDISAHPFTSGTMGDVRLTTRYNERFLPTSLFGVLHEGGHALYEQGLDKENFRFPAGQACSLGIHESQSRFWENLIGRSKGFWQNYFKRLNQLADNAFDGVSLDDFFKGINCVSPTYIRVEADEVTYNLHIILRYEIEKELINGSLKPKDLPEMWNEKFYDFFGVKPPTFSEGVMQDVHWSVGLIGYFPTYTLGNLYSGMIKEAIEKEMGSLDELSINGKLKQLRDWLKEKIHSKGRFYPPKELILKTTNENMSEKPFLDYLTKKYDDLIGV
ncbi:MAG: carboxypeptidase M32, partial [Acidobacteria bacterium]|nr:carboxypeptidase M32 [Acidobacteriota bacterium]